MIHTTQMTKRSLRVNNLRAGDLSNSLIKAAYKMPKNLAPSRILLLLLNFVLFSLCSFPIIGTKSEGALESKGNL